MTEDDLRGIAALDYGTGLQEHRKALQRIVEGDLSVLRPMGWHPQEVLELARWDEGDDEEWTEARHRRRLFACTALLVAAADPRNGGRMMSVNESAIIAVASLLEASPDHARELVEVLDHLAERWRGDDELPHLMLARFLLLEAAGAPPEELASMLEAADRTAAEVRGGEYFWKPPRGTYGWVLDLTAFDQRARLWRKWLDAALARRRGDPASATVAEKLAALRERRE